MHLPVPAWCGRTSKNDVETLVISYFGSRTRFEKLKKLHRPDRSMFRHGNPEAPASRSLWRAGSLFFVNRLRFSVFFLTDERHEYKHANNDRQRTTNTNFRWTNMREIRDVIVDYRQTRFITGNPAVITSYILNATEYAFCVQYVFGRESFASACTLLWKRFRKSSRQHFAKTLKSYLSITPQWDTQI